MPINDIIKPSNGNSIFGATDIGVFYTTDEGEYWNILDSGLPQVVITDLVHHEDDNLLVAATYGRGMYRLDLDELISSTDQPVDVKTLALTAFPNPFSENTSIKVSITHSGNYSINILDIKGNLVKNISSNYMEQGDHAFEFASTQFPPGLYLCEVKNATTHKIIRLIKANQQ